VCKDELLQLIEEGDPTVILSSEYIEGLNDLIKHEFVYIENDRLKLTEKGEQAKIIGIQKMMTNNPPVEEHKELRDFSQTSTLSGISNHSFLIILVFFLVSILAILTLISS